MKVVYLTELEHLEVANGPKPKIQNPNALLIKIKSVGVCGSDVHYFKHGRIGRQIVKFPYVVGHECAGIVEAVGSAVKNFKPGDRVVVDPAISCRKCRQCQVGRYHTCENLKFLGTPASATSAGLDGCLSEYIVMPELSIFALPASFSFEDGALMEPLTIGYYSVVKGEIQPEQTAAILGTGPIGLSVLTILQLKSMKAIYTTDLIPERVAIAQKMGATHSFNSDQVNAVSQILEREPAGVDLVFECAGEQATIDEAIELLKPGGTLVLIGIPQAERISGDIDLLRRKEIRIQNIRRQNECTQPTINAIEANKSDLSLFKTHRFAPEQAQAAYELVGNYQDGVIKAFINWD